MRWVANFVHPNSLSFIIEQQMLHNTTDRKDETEFLLCVYENAALFIKDLESVVGGCNHFQRDFAQDTLEIAKQQAFEDFGVPPDSWIQVKE